jgi:YajG family uncharacterized lipoprotein
VSAPRWPAMLLWIAMAVSLLGCSNTVAIDVGYPKASVNRATLASARPRRVEIRPVADRRGDTTRIGVQPDEKKKAVVTSRPVTDIVREALVAELQRNGHVVVPDRSDLVIAADVDEFAYDVVVARASAQYVGKVALALAVTDRQSGKTLFTRRYVGIKRQNADRDAEHAARDVMDAALARAMHDLATDAELAQAFGDGRPDVQRI